MSIPIDTDEITGADLAKVIVQDAREWDRSIQLEMGPSEVGETCERKLMLKVLGSKTPNISRDEWNAIIGTSAHAVAAQAFIRHNAKLIAAKLPARWLVEQTITVRTGLIGHCDLYDLWTNTVIDHKFPGAKSIREKRKVNHPGPQYADQGQLYGMGWENLGLPVKNVGICFYPRSGMLRDVWLWTEPYSREKAQKALDRMDNLLIAANISEANGLLTNYMESLILDTSHCEFCPYFDRTNTDPTNGCKGPFSDPDYEARSHDQTVPGIL